MRTFKNYMEAAKAKKLEETGEEGFSLIELIVVVVILGILAAVAIPIFLNIQAQANDNAGKTAAANGATQAAAQLAQTPTATVDFTNLETGNVTDVSITKYTSPNIDTICVTATYTGGAKTTWASGPGAKADGTCK